MALYVNRQKLAGLVADMGMGVVEFCTLAGISTATWRNVFEFNRPVRLPTLHRISKAVSVRAQDLLSDAGETPLQ